MQLVEREAELERLAAALTEVTAGPGAAPGPSRSELVLLPAVGILPARSSCCRPSASSGPADGQRRS